MKTRISSSALLILGLALSACAEEPAKINTPAPSPAMVVGGDRDAHGCIGSAGYTWCARENACVRPWELAREKGFATSAENFENYCSGNKK